MANEAFVNSVVQEIIQPGLQRLMDGQFFSELREGQTLDSEAPGMGITTVSP